MQKPKRQRRYSQFHQSFNSLKGKDENHKMEHLEQPAPLLQDMAALSPPLISIHHHKIHVIHEESITPRRRLSERPSRPPPTRLPSKRRSMRAGMTKTSRKYSGFDKARRLPDPPMFQDEDFNDSNQPRSHLSDIDMNQPTKNHSDTMHTIKDPSIRKPKRSVSMHARQIHRPLSQRKQSKTRIYEYTAPLQPKRATSVHGGVPSLHDTFRKDSSYDEEVFNPAGLRRSTSIHVPKPDTEKVNDAKDTFSPRRNKSIHAGFSKTLSKSRSMVDHRTNDVWIECLFLKNNGETRTHFKSLHGQEYRKEPPTGATTIIYLEDFVERERDSVATTSNISSSNTNNRRVKKNKKKGLLRKKFKSFMNMVNPPKETS